jgi:hypothetical protein
LKQEHQMQVIPLTLFALAMLKMASASFQSCESMLGPCSGDICCSANGGTSNNAFLWCVGGQYNPNPYTCPSNECQMTGQPNTAICPKPPQPSCQSYVGQSCTVNTCCSTDGGGTTDSFVWCIGGNFNPTPNACPSGVLCTMAGQPNTAICPKPSCQSYVGQSCTVNTCCSTDGGGTTDSFVWCINGNFNPSPYTCPGGSCSMGGQPSTAQCSC